ncbi:hypothetical protein [Granulicoccus phenolivorans]|uniref:hypothetical protein n=1 Tax=Granulicoccus phenolivorans TaxID=266854 RepID=UPI000404DE37|nr:hypothetical protein [Granulicoccus phenolivorans]
MRWLRRWAACLIVLAMIVGYVVVVFWQAGRGTPGATPVGQAMVSAGILGVLALVLSPAFFPRARSHAYATEHPDQVAVYFHPASVLAIWLRLTLRNLAKRAIWVDVWKDPAAQAFLREQHQNMDITPTAVHRGEVKALPKTEWVAQRLLTQSPAPGSESTSSKDSE